MFRIAVPKYRHTLWSRTSGRQSAQDNFLKGKDDEAKFLRGVSTLGKDLSCCLCLSTFERPVRTSCKHYYCAECLNESLRRKQQCPLCKTKVTRRDVEDDEFVAALVWKYRRIVTAANAS